MDFVTNLFKKSKPKTVAPSKQPELNNSPNKNVNLLDATTTTFDNSILMPATDPENLNTLGVTSTNQENQRPRFSILGTFDPIYQKKESTDNGKSDSTDVDIRSLIDETFTKQSASELIDESLQQRSDENISFATSFVNDCVKIAVDGADLKLIVPENEFNKSNVSNVSSVSDVSEQNNTVILSKTFTENKEDTSADISEIQNNNPDKSVSDSVLSVSEETPIKLVPHLKFSEATGVSELSDSFLEKFTRATVISTPSSNNTTRATENILDNTFSKENPSEVPINPDKFTEELDLQDADSIELENPISQSEDFDTDSLNEEIESAQNEILHELSVESNKIVCELNRTQEIYNEAVAPDTTQENITIVAETDSNKDKSFEIIDKEKLQPVKLEQKEQIIQEINVTYSEPISPNKLERQEESLIEQDKSQFEKKEPVSQVISPAKVSLELVGPQSPKPVILEQTEEVEISVKKEITSESKSPSIEIFVKEDPTEKAISPVVPEEKESISQESETKNTEPISLIKVEVLTEAVDKNTPVKSIENPISFEISSTPTITKTAHVLDSAVNKNISFVIDSSPIAKVKQESPQKLSDITKQPFAEIKQELFDTGSSPTINVVDSAEAKPVDKNISFVIEPSSIVTTKPETPQKLCEALFETSANKSTHEVVDLPTEAKPGNENLSFVIDVSPIVKANPESPQKLSEISASAVNTSTREVELPKEEKPVNKNISFVLESSPIVKASPQKFSEVSFETPASKSSHEVVPPIDAKPVNKNLSFVLETSPIVKASPQKLSEVSFETSASKSSHEVVPSIDAKPVNKNLSFVIESSPIVKANPASPQKLSEVYLETPVNKSSHEVHSPIDTKPIDKNLSFVIQSSPIVKSNPVSPQKLSEVSIETPVNKSSHEVDPPIEVKPVNKNISFIIESPIAKVQEKSPEKVAVEAIKNKDLDVKLLEQISKISSDEIFVKTPQKVEILATPIVEPVISESSEIKDKHMSEAKPIEKSEVSESAVTNLASTNEMGEVINQKDCFQKQSDITNGAVDNKETLDPKNEMYNEMVERLSLLESDCEKYKIQIADLKREIKTCRQKSISLESEVADLKRKENELNILLDEYKNKKPDCTDADGKDEELKLLRASEETLKNEVVELKVLLKQHENKLKELQQKEVKLADDLSSKTQSELQISRVMEEYEKSISSLVAENEKMKKERDTAQMHLSNIELAFSDVHQKYERCKRVVQGYKDNEESYRQDIAMNRETIATQEQKYATLKAHAMAQLEKSNQELLGIKKQHETEMARLTAQLKRYEIKNDSLMEALQQKTKECEQLSAVCDEFIGNV